MNNIKIAVIVNPGKPKTMVKDITENDTLIIEISALPYQNKANNELIRFLERNLGGKVRILRGKRSRNKLVEIMNPRIKDWKEKLLNEK